MRRVAPAYDFEDHAYRGLEDATRYREVFLQRLETTLPQDAAIEKLLLDFATDVHLNIAWYKRALRRERRVWHGLLGLTLALIVATPLGVFLMAKRAEAGVASEITTVLTGLFALYRVVVAAFDRRERFALFHEAGAELKEILYRFEQDWRGRVVAENFAAFTAALKKAIADARIVVKQEQKQFFRTFEKQAPLDLGGVFSRSTRDAASLTTTILPRGIESPEDARRGVAEAEARVGALRKLLQATELEVAAARAKSDKIAEELNVGTLKAVHRSLERAEIELAEAQARARSFEPR